MRKYHGKLVHRSRDADGPLEVVDDGLTRTLHFGNDTRQSTMALADPVHLMLVYPRAMMSCLLFPPAPRRVLLIGLGGGSLAKFLLHYFPRCEGESVVRRAAVVRLAHGYFQLPESPRLRVHVEDARDFLAQDTPHRYDLILLVVFVVVGLVVGCAVLVYLAACRARLAPL